MPMLAAALTLTALAAIAAAAPPVVIDTPMAPPQWALLERELLRYNSDACERFASKYLDSRGYLLHTPRWGTLDGPDDAIETFYNWTLLHALGGADRILDLFKKAQEGHWRQYNELRTTLTPLAANGAYHREFITMSDWFHTGEGMRAILLQGLSEPGNAQLTQRLRRFAGLYMNEDPQAPNYDPARKIIRSIWNGSQGPMLRQATVYDWVGDPVPGSFHLLHNPARLTARIDMKSVYKKMLAHCDEYLDSVGDNNLNLASTILALNAHLLTGDPKYKRWLVEYVDAWRERTAAAGGNIPSNIGLDGTLGGEHKGQWWKGTYGWNFTIFDGELEQIAHRNYFTSGSWPGFSNAWLMTGDPRYLQVLRRQMDNIYAQKKVENGRTLLPQMYGDPRGYKYDGPPQWYHYTGNLFEDRLTEIYLWSMDRHDLARIPVAGWLAYLEGQDPQFPVRALERDVDHIRQRMQRMRNDSTTAATRLADYLLDFNPAATDALVNLTLGGYFARGRIWVLHSRFRYFDPAARRAGLPPGVAALVESLSADSATVILVNTNPIDARELVVQAGAYAEHRFDTLTLAGKTVPLNASSVNLHLAPGSGARLSFRMTRYVNSPTYAFPWNGGRASARAGL